MSRSANPRVSLPVRLRAHLSIARLDHSIKNLFVLPGIVVPLSVDSSLFNFRLIYTLLLAFVAITLVACSNYVINEVLELAVSPDYFQYLRRQIAGFHADASNPPTNR